MPVPQRTPGGLDDLERAGDAGAVARFKLLRGRGSRRVKLGVQRLHALAFETQADSLADLGWNRRHRRQPSGQRLEVKAGAADENGQTVFGPRLAQNNRCVRNPRTGRAVYRRVAVAIQPMRRSRFILRRGTRGDDPQVAINLHGIRVDDDAAGGLRKSERQRRLAAGRWPCDKHRFWNVLFPLHTVVQHQVNMSLVATLICNPAEPELDSTAIDAARSALPSPEHGDWLFEGVAADIRFSSTDDIHTISNRLREAMDGIRADIVVQPQLDRRKKLLLADMDSTMIGQECIDELADFAGLKAHVAAITERAMRGEIEFEPALRERVALLKDLPDLSGR